MQTLVPAQTAQPQAQAEVKTDVQKAADIINTGSSVSGEGAVPIPAEPTKPTEDFSEKFAALSREQKKIWEEKQKLKAIQAEVDAYKKKQELKKQNPYAFLKEEGLSLNEILEMAAKDGEPPSAEDRIAQLEAKLEAKFKEQQDREEKEKQSREQEAVDKFRQNLETHIKGKADDYELINAQNAFGIVFEVIAQHYDKTLQETGTAEIMDMDKAAQAVETHLFNELQKLKGLKKVSGLFTEALQAKTDPQAPAPKEPAQPQGSGFTLNGSVVPRAGDTQTKPLSVEESKRRAASLIRWT
jgi:hypothetical protein